jgi:hypothetical protein
VDKLRLGLRYASGRVRVGQGTRGTPAERTGWEFRSDRIDGGNSEGATGAFRSIGRLAPQLESANNGLPVWFLMLAAHIFSMLATTGVGIGTKSRSSAILSPFE